MPIYSASEIIGKDLFTKVNMNVRSNATTESSILANIKKGNRAGTVYSYVYGTDKTGKKDGSIWWQLEGLYNGKTGFVKHNEGWYDVKALKAQGAQTAEEKKEEKEDADKPWYEKMFEGLKKDTRNLLIGGALVFVTVKLGQSAIQANANKNQKALPQ